MKPRVWDTFIFGTQSDLDILECRLTELDQVAHRFVVAESAVSHQGRPKPMHLLDNWDRFSPWHDRIIYIDATAAMREVPPPPDRMTYWPIEHAQRETIGPALAGAAPEDWILHGDVDEIPRPASIKPGYCLAAQHHAYCLEWLCDDGWRSLVCVRAADAPASVQGIRNLMAVLPELPAASWHLSWFGGLEAARAKFRTTVHADIPPRVAADAERMIRDGWHWQGHWRKLKPYRGSDFPRWVREGREPASWHRSGALSAVSQPSPASAAPALAEGCHTMSAPQPGTSR